MTKILFTICLLLGAMSVNAQTSSQSEDAKVIELRQKLGIDYSMPDFSTSKIDGRVIGERLAKMLQLLQSKYDDYLLNQNISLIQCQQIENLNYAIVEKLNITRIFKVGDVITIEAKTKLGNNAAKVKNGKLSFVFNKGVSESTSVNDLFKDLGRYIKE
jgi:hypothetical protein